MAEYIDREEFCKKYCHCNVNMCEKEKCPVFAMPAADVAPVVHGRWVEGGDGTHFCSECKSPANYDSVEWDYRGKKREDLTNYCYSCGAKMEGDSV